MNQIAANSLSALVHALDDAVLAPPGSRAEAAAAALKPYLDRTDLLAGHDCPCSAERYARHSLHEDPAGRYCLVAIVWRPGQESPIHAHKTWCAFGIHKGAIVESFFAVPDATHPEFKDAVLRRGQRGDADPGQQTYRPRGARSCMLRFPFLVSGRVPFAGAAYSSLLWLSPDPQPSRIDKPFSRPAVACIVSVALK